MSGKNQIEVTLQKHTIDKGSLYGFVFTELLPAPLSMANQSGTALIPTNKMFLPLIINDKILDLAKKDSIKPLIINENFRSEDTRAIITFGKETNAGKHPITYMPHHLVIPLNIYKIDTNNQINTALVIKKISTYDEYLYINLSDGKSRVFRDHFTRIHTRYENWSIEILE